MGSADSVFVNCPFDRDYLPLFESIIFTVFDCCLILEDEPYSFQKSLSDIAGQDIIPHGNSPDRVLAAVRNWLQGASGRRTVPGTSRIRERFTAFADDLPELAKAAEINKNQLTFLDDAHLVEGWLAHSGMHSRSAKQGIGS